MINLKDILTESVMTFEDANELVKKLKKQIDAPEVGASIATIGGKEKPSVILSVSLNPKNEWPNGIYMNSMYSKFYITYDGIIEQFAKNYKIKKKFRKSRFKNTDDVIKKINKYIKEIEKTINESVNENKKYNTLDDFEKVAKIGNVFYLGNETQFKRATKKDYYKVVDKKPNGEIVISKGNSKKRYTIGADLYDETVILVKESTNERIGSDKAFESINESKVHYQKKLKNGTTFQVIGRDTKGMRGTQDKFQMQIVDKSGKVVKDLGSHPSVKGAEKFGNKFESVNESDDTTSLKKIHDSVFKFLKTKKGVGEVKELSEFPNRYGDNVSTFSVRYNIEDKYNYDKQEIKIEYSTSRVFIPNKGYFPFKTFNDIKNIINKKSKLKESVNEAQKKLPKFKNIPSWAKYVAQHSDGEWFFYEETPTMIRFKSGGGAWKQDGNQISAGVKTDGKDWDKRPTYYYVKNGKITESVNEDTKNTFNSFKKDFDNVITHSNAYLEGDKIKIYLDTNPNKEKNIINKLIRTKYSDKLKKARSEDDVMVFKIIERQYESLNERYRPNVESKGWEAAQKVIRQLQSSVFKKLDDDELLEFRKAIADAFNLDGILKENNIKEGKITKTFHFKGKTSTDIDEIDADFSRQGIKSEPDFNNRKVTVTGDERKIDKIAKFYRGIEETTINERRGGMDVIRRIVKNHQYEGGVDVQTANMILKVYDGVDNKTKKFLDHATLKQIVNLILKARR